jgi:hypothetical protein
MRNEESAYDHIQNIGRIEYLKMIQDVISRMSSTSAILKGFAATVVTTGISAILFTQVDKVVLLLFI